MKEETAVRQKENAARNSSIELLRIIAMLIIVFHHFANYGISPLNYGVSDFPLWWNGLLKIGGKLGVDIFVLISGYFLINTKDCRLNLRRLLKLWGQILFYSVVLWVVGYTCITNKVGLRSLVKAFMPIIYPSKWFAATYFMLYLIHPYLNKLLHHLDKATYQKMLLLIVLCWSIIPTFTTSLNQSNNLIWFVILYAIAGYIRLYGLNSQWSSKQYFRLFCASALLQYLSFTVFSLLGTRWHIFAENQFHFYLQEQLTVLVSAVSLFMTFEKMTLNYNKWINVIASGTFGVYLIHDNTYIRNYVWNHIFHFATHETSVLIIPYTVLTVAIIFTVSLVIDLLRKRFVEKPFLKLVDRAVEPITNFGDKICIRIRSVIFGKDSQDV